MTSESPASWLACPRCRGALEPRGEGVLLCPDDETTVTRVAGIWRLHAPPPDSALGRFASHYRRRRNLEGWGVDDEISFRALPEVPDGDPHARIWRIRAASFRVLLAVLESSPGPRLLDLGAGNGWLSHRLGGLGYDVAAIDLSDDPRDGLGAWPLSGDPPTFVPVQASFDDLPCADASVDAAIWNGAFHYSCDPAHTLGEACRVLVDRGLLVIVDSPFYAREVDGRKMLAERATLHRPFDVAEASELPVGFLTPERLAQTTRGLGLSWRRRALPLGWRWRLAPWWARARGRRPPARFPVLFAHRPPRPVADGGIHGRAGFGAGIDSIGTCERHAAASDR